MIELFPLEVGNVAQIVHAGRDTTYPQGWRTNRRCAVEAEETITVPAGSFDTFRIRCIQGENLGNPTRTRVYHYSPELGYYVRYYSRKRGESAWVRELMSYELPQTT